MSSRWFRFYSDAMRSPKVAALSDRDFRLWVQLLAVASDNDGLIPPLGDLKHMLKARLDHLLAGVQRLISVGLIDALESGYEPHNWAKFQYKSDTSTDRVNKHRAKRNVSETAPEAETDTDTEPPKPPRGGNRSKPKGAMIFLSKAVELETTDGRDRSQEGAGAYRGDACRIPGSAISDQRSDGGSLSPRRIELLDHGG